MKKRAAIPIIVSFFVILGLVSCKDTFTGTENGHKWVDLGLSVKWATCNVGSSDSNPGYHGNYFAWGEITPKNNYSWATYQYTNNTALWKFSMTKFGPHTFHTFTDDKYCMRNKKVLNLSEDAANVNWGGRWRMPTKEELDELFENCTLKRLTLKNGFYGVMLTSKVNGKEIFLPAGGYMGGTTRGKENFFFYWSSSLQSDEYAYHTNTDAGGSHAFNWNDGDRCYGMLVRPVCP